MTLDVVYCPITEIVGGVVSPVMPGDATPLERCNAEIATALQAVLSGSLRLEEALLYYWDWCWERKLILAEQVGIPPAIFFSGRRKPAARLSNTHHRTEGRDSTSQARNFSRAEVRAGLEGFQERQRDRDKERVTQKDYCRMYSATLRDVAKKARAQQRAATSVPPGPSRVIPRSPQQTSPTIGAWPDGIAARHSA